MSVCSDRVFAARNECMNSANGHKDVVTIVEFLSYEDFICRLGIQIIHRQMSCGILAYLEDRVVDSYTVYQ